MPFEGIEEGLSGFRLEGRWREVAEYGERLARVLRDATLRPAVEDWECRRPKLEDSSGDVAQKTVDMATVERPTWGGPTVQRTPRFLDERVHRKPMPPSGHHYFETELLTARPEPGRNKANPVVALHGPEVRRDVRDSIPN